MQCIIRPQRPPEDPTRQGHAWRSVVQECRDYVPVLEGSCGVGAGLLIASSGLIVTNRHVVEGSRALSAALYDGTRSKAVRIHQHPARDLAIVRASVQRQRFFDIFSRVAADYEPGDEVLAIGHPRGLSFTSTRGIISECRRVLPEGDFVQTDVAINPGNSGGPLLDDRGRLVGLNTLVRTDSQGLGFAIPVREVVEYCQEVLGLVESGRLAIPSDQEIASSQAALGPDEIFECAARLADLGYEKTPSDTGDAWHVHTPKGHTFTALINRQLCLLLLYIAPVRGHHATDASFLLQLLRWQNDMQVLRFVVTEEDNLYLEFSRPPEDLDVSEVCQALTEMATVADSILDNLLDFMEE